MSAMDENLIREMAAEALDVANVAADPVEQFRRWYAQAHSAGIPREDAMTLATLGAGGAPAARIVLYKDLSGLGFSEPGFPFFTNYESDKAAQLTRDARAALVFHWKPPARQVRAEGSVEKLPAEVSDAYFASRPRGSQIGAWASPQSRVVPSRAFIEAKERALGNPIRRARRAASSPLGRLRLKTPLGRILAAPRQPPPRPRALHAGSGWWVAHREIGAIVTTRPQNFRVPCRPGNFQSFELNIRKTPFTPKVDCNLRGYRLQSAHDYPLSTQRASVSIREGKSASGAIRACRQNRADSRPS